MCYTQNSFLSFIGGTSRKKGSLTMSNLSKLKREKLIEKLNVIRESYVDDDEMRSILNEIESELNSKKYGLIWEEHEERVDIDMLTKIPVFTEEKDKEIHLVENDRFNFLLEGDNLHSLYLLEKTHKNSIDIIYIDPPYNTLKNDFIYNDVMLGKTDGFKHSKWLSFMEKRLRIAHRLLSKEGVIFISIDDNEFAQLKLLCDEIFGEYNFIANIIWEKAYSPVNLKKHFSENHDYILCYAKSKIDCVCNGLQRSEEANSRYKNPDNDPRGPWKPADSTVGPAVPEKIYKITTPSGREVYPSSGRCWLYTEDRFKEMIDDNRIWFGTTGNNIPSVKKFLSEVKNTTTPLTIWKYTEVGHSQDAKQSLKDMFNGKSVFDYPKSVPLIKRMIELYSKENSIILDFFAGSATTAQAVLECNQKDGGNRRFILCTNNENNICQEVSYPRIKKVIEGYKITNNDEVNGIKANLKYYKTDFIPRFPEDESISELSMKHIVEMIQLQHGVSIDNRKYLLILTDEDADELLIEINSLTQVKAIYISSNVLLTSHQKILLKETRIATYIIPDYYFESELKEGGE